MLIEDPTLEASEIREILLSEADKIPGLTAYCEDGNRLNAYAAVAYCHTHRFTYTTTATTHTGTCACGTTTGTIVHIWGMDLDGTRICRVCGYYRVGQIESVINSEIE